MIDINKYVGQIVTLDMVNGKELTLRIKSVDEDKVSCSKPLMFVPVPDEQKPNHTKVIALPYGHPMYEVNDIVLDVNHIITVFQPSQEQKDSYAKHTGSIVAAPANALDNLPDLSKFQI